MSEAIAAAGAIHGGIHSAIHSVIHSAYDEQNTRQTDVLIIGAGLAGLSTALSLPPSLSITVLSKSALEVCSSHYAQGGIAASLDKNDSIADHVADTLIAGAGLCEADSTFRILSAGQQAVQWLCTQGVPFTQMPKLNGHSDAQQTTTQPHTSNLQINELPSHSLQISDLHLTKEGGHSCRRVAHADDATGQYMMETLTAKAHAASNITVLPYHEALQLLTMPVANDVCSRPVALRQCQGALVFDHIRQRQLTIHSRAVVLASGGLGQLFQRASAPNVCVGDGVMMAWQAGCRLANLEFIQFHPTGLAFGDSRFLISEALRGEGGHLYCPTTNTRFMLAIDARAELAPRDIVARVIAEQIDINGLGYVHLSVSHLPASFITAHFPKIYQTLLTLGIDMTTDPIPVAPTAHYSCGGVVTSADGHTDVVGLYAAGEVAHTGLHGANRLASNSLLECVVVGRHIAADLPRYLNEISALNTEQPIENIWTQPCLERAHTVELSSLPNECTEANAKRHNEANEFPNADVANTIVKLKALMTQHMGITRRAKSLEQALIQVQAWQRYFGHDKLSLPAFDNQNSAAIAESLAHFQLNRQLQLAVFIIQCAYQRVESRGGHYRQDHPQLAANPQISVIKPLIKQTYHQANDVNPYGHKPSYDEVAVITV
ncbi:FAD-dependent oxidoreductase [Psychrobacter sp. B38]|uniref:L-aspartate oxidase n=1 Tax=Psychrobacter sp. B38 TaxID=3143538 RepID=UPI00320C9218